MKKQSLLFSLILTLVFASFAVAQEKLLTLDEIYNPDTRARVQFSGRPTFVQWTADGASFMQAKPGAGGLTIVRIDPKTGAETPFFSTSDVTAALTKTGLGAEAAQKAAGSIGQHFNESQTAMILSDGKDIFLYDMTAKTARRLTNDAAEELESDFSPDGKMISYVKGMNLYVVDVATGKETQLTKDGNENLLNGYLDWVYEEELYGRGNKRGYWWSPDSSAIAFLRTDESPVKKFTVVNHEGLYQVVETTPYPKAGEPNPLVKIGVAEVKNGQVKFVDTSGYKPEDFLVSRVTWTPDSKMVLYQAQNREQTFLDLNAAARDTGKTQLLFKETSPAWVEVIDNPTFLKDGSGAIWQSAARTGYKHLYLFDNNGKLIRPLTSGEWEVSQFHGVDDKNGWVYFSGSKDSFIASNAYRVKLDGTGLQRLTQGTGTHSVSFNKDFTHFVDTYSDINTPPQTRLFRADGTLERVMNENKVEVLSQYKLGKPEFMQVKAKDGFVMEALMIKPPDFDPNKKYPVMQFTYAGPHAPQVRNAWLGSTEMWYHMLAQKGIIVWLMDNRSASGKGEKSAYPAYGRLGETELADIEDGLNYLKSLPYVDGSRIGIHGWSYGGFMTSYALTHSKSFKIGIAGGTVADWRLYDSIYTERYMKTPQNNPEGYDRTSVIKAAPNLHGKLMLVHGVIDENVHLQNTLQLAYELQRAGKQFQLMIYPTQRHGIGDPRQAKHFRQMMTDFILENL